MTLDVRLIRQAQTLAACGSFSRAAEALGISQPGLSRSIKDLESELGLPLFTRHRFGVEPTDFGHMFLQQSALLVTQFADLEREVALAKGVHKGELSVGFGPYAADALVPEALAHFASAHPSVRLRIQVDALESLGRALRTRSADLIVGESTVVGDDDAIEIVTRLAPISGYLVARAGHPLASKRTVSMADALDYPFVQIARLPPRVLKPMLGSRRRPGLARERPVPPFPAIECPSVPLGVSAVLHSDALMLAALGMVRREVVEGRLVPILHEPWMRTDWAIMRLRRRTLGPVATAFVETLQRVHAAAVALHAALESRRTPGPQARRSSPLAPGGTSKRTPIR